MNIFIADVTGQKGVLRADESWHCARVLRKKAGDQIHLIDGKGNFYEAELEQVNDRQCTVRVINGPSLQPERLYHLHLAIAPTKNIDRIEWLLEKVTEIGIREITFIHCQNSERTVIKHERLIKIVESAVKQSLQARIPIVHELVTFRDFVRQVAADQKFIAHCFDDAPKRHLRSIDWKGKKSVVLVGPEGDFTRQELLMAQENSFVAISLGDSRLRTETAGLYVCQAAALLTA